MPLDLHATARRVGSYVWIEERLFEVLGGWATGAGADADPVAGARFAAGCSHHAWHAQLWRDRLPAVPGTEAATWIVPGDPSLPDFVERLAAAPGAIERLVGLVRVVTPRLIDAYAEHEAAIDPALDQPTTRALTLVLRDERDDRAADEALLATHLRAPDADARAAAWQSELESLLPATLARR